MTEVSGKQTSRAASEADHSTAGASERTLPPVRLTGNRNEFVLDGRKELTSDAYTRCNDDGFHRPIDCSILI